MSVIKSDALAGKVAFIAGASSGINLGIAHHFAAHGAKVALISRSHEKITAAAKEIADKGYDVLGMAADVRDFESVDGALARTEKEFGKLDIVVSGAAGNFVAPALGMSSNGFKTVVDIDLIGTFNVLRGSFQYLNRPGASLISITAPQGVQPSFLRKILVILPDRFWTWMGAPSLAMRAGMHWANLPKPNVGFKGRNSDARV